MTLQRLAVQILTVFTPLLLFIANSQAQKAHLAVAAHSMAQIAHFVAQEKGYYREEGLEPRIVMMSAPVAGLALIGGNVEFGGVSGSLLPPILTGAPLRFVLSAFYRPMFWLYSRPDIKVIKDLKGKRVGVSGIASGPATLLMEVLKRHGLEGGRDVTILGMGIQPTLYTALTSGAIDASIFIPPYIFRAQEAGFRELISFIKEDFVELQGSIIVREAFLRTDALLVEKFIRGTLKGLRYARDNRSGTIPILARNTNTTAELAAKDYDLARPGIALAGTVTEAYQKKYLELGQKRLGLKEIPSLEKIFNFALTRKINSELDAAGWLPGP
jgi:NitT/TauT family transport system substrate-binding protein